jgi:O-antigen/teichoic acid export membrane protein
MKLHPVLRRAKTDGTVIMMTGTLVAGGAAYLWQAAGTRTLGSDAFAPVATTWTVAFLITTILLAPIEQFAIRTISEGHLGRAHLAKAMPVLVRFTGISALVIGAVAFALRDSLFHGAAGYAVICLATVFGFGQLAFLRGILAGMRDFAAYGRLSALDSLLRLGVGAPLLLFGGSALAFAWTIPACTVVALLWVRNWPRREDSRWDVAPGVPAGRFIATTVGGSSAAQIILAGGPLLLALLGAPNREVTILFVTQTAMRAAFLIATPAWARALPPLTGVALRAEHWRLSRLAEAFLAGSVVVGLVCAGAAAAVGPLLVATLFGSGSRPDAALAALMAGGTVLAIGNLGLNQLLVATVRTHRITVAWWAALLASLLWIFAAPGTHLHRVGTGFVVGEFVALVALTIASSPRLSPARLRSETRRMRAAHSPSEASPSGHDSSAI